MIAMAIGWATLSICREKPLGNALRLPTVCEIIDCLSFGVVLDDKR